MSMWQEFCHTHAFCGQESVEEPCGGEGCTSSLTDGRFAQRGAAARGGATSYERSAVDKVSCNNIPHFYWTWDDQEEEETGQRYCLLLCLAHNGEFARPQVVAVPCWVPSKLLGHLPFFPIHERQAGQQQASLYKPLHPDSPSPARGAAPVGLPMTDVALLGGVRYMTNFTSFWNRLASSVGALTVPHYLPLEAAPYFHTLFVLRHFRSRLSVCFQTKTTQRMALSRNVSLATPVRGRCVEGGDDPCAAKANVVDACDVVSSYASNQKRPYMYTPESQRTICCLGKTYVSTTDTALSCFLDSATCVQHGVPLDENGNVFFAGIEALRRQMHERGAIWGGRNKGRAAGTTVVQHDRSPFIASARWTRLWAPSSASSPTARALAWRRARRSSHFAFQSPYWVDVGTARERWGVDILAGAQPVRVRSRLYVNAEETSDASRFNSHTCTPQRTHKVLCESEVFVCSWHASARLRRLCLDGGTQNGRHAAGDASSAPITYATLMREAAELYRCCNLWVTESLMRRLGWTLMQPSEMQVTASISEADRDVSDTMWQCDSSAAARTMRIVNAVSIVEQSELLFLLSYSPVIYLDAVADLREDDDGFDEWRRAAVRREEALRGRTRISETAADVCTAKAGTVPSEKAVNKLYASAMRLKRRQVYKWLGNTLPLTFRLHMAILALQKGYSLQDRDTWFTTDFVGKTPFMTQRHPSVAALHIKLYRWQNVDEASAYAVHGDEDSSNEDMLRCGANIYHPLPLVVINKGEIAMSDELDARLTAPVNIKRRF